MRQLKNGRAMQEQLRYHYLHSVSTFNILPVTSRCMFSCLFCSHRQNPPGVEAFTVPDLTLSMVDELFIFLDPTKKIVIGESATRCLEGEPFCNKSLLDILDELRRKFTDTPFHIATNGTLLTKKTVMRLKKLMPVELSVSVNILDPALRHTMLGEVKTTDMLSILSRLSDSEIPFSTSILALPGFTGKEALEDTAAALSQTKSEVIKLYWCSVTDYTSPEVAAYIGERDSLMRFHEKMKGEVKTPIFLEPPLLSDLKVITEGAVIGSPGEKAGIQAGDEILFIDVFKPRSRVDAFHCLNALNKPARLVVRRDGRIRTLKLSLSHSERPGITFLYDIDSDYFEALKNACMRAQRPLIITSELALPMLQAGLRRDNLDVPTVSVKNRFFGGTIGCAGLMTVRDIMTVIPKDGNFTEILLPIAPFDGQGRDLTGRSWLDIEESTGLKVTVI